MPLAGSCHRLSTNRRSSSLLNAGYRVPSLRSKNPPDFSRSSWRIWKPYFSSFERSARRHSWIEPFLSSAVHSEEISGMGRASYSGVAISPFPAARIGFVRWNRHGATSLGWSRRSTWSRRKRGRRGAYFARRALARKYGAGPRATATTAAGTARSVRGVRFTAAGRSRNASADTAGSWKITSPAGYTYAPRIQKPTNEAPWGARNRGAP